MSPLRLIRNGIALAGLCTAVASCELVSPICDTSVPAAFEVAIRDSTSGTPVAEGASGVVRKGSFVDTLRPALRDGDGTLLTRQATQTPPGTYDIEIQHPGYELWLATGARTRVGSCGRETTHLTARLQPETPP